ncbi:hypothetical protein C8A03DRAFT_33461 [Achaetomium macrosporum]|uniref:Uncharacterized protein n=1 Tax=Achaetomium macrosporum TaxID=79813 RepID=A0AAN7CC11_9PEZI|nr:hypothetical protein C8A03DRAFT_33461 [Achaetomium macrosporum]
MIRHLVERQREVLKSLVLALRRLNPADQEQLDPREDVHLYNNSFTVRDNGAMTINISHERHEGLAKDAESIKLLAQGIKGASQETVVSVDEMLVLLLTELDTMRDDADYTHTMLINLLDLKQKAAALAEARSTSQQGRIIMPFTIVTITFVSLAQHAGAA